MEKEGKVIEINKETDPVHEIPNLIKKAEGKIIKFNKVKGHDIEVVGGVGSSRELIAKSLGINQSELLFKMAHAVENPIKPELLEKAPCQEIIIKGKDVDLKKIPLLTHYEKDGGPFITSGVLIVSNDKWGRNIATHRMMYYGEKNKLVVRICERDTMAYLKDAGGLIDAAVCIGVHPAVQLASATRVKIDQDEMEIANALSKTTTVRCVTNGLGVPAESEIVLEGKLSLNERVKEGPFVDITGTYDLPKREEPVFTVEAITMRKNALWHALFPGMGEHRLYMGMPREPTIFNEVKKVCECKNVVLPPGGCGWLNCIVQIKKKNEDDGKKAIEAAFKGHESLKHVWVVDDDIDIFNRDELEWAFATRFQGNKDMIVSEGKGSSVDPSAEPIPGTDRQKTTNIGFDATIPWDKPRESFERPRIPNENMINLEDYTGD